MSKMMARSSVSQNADIEWDDFDADAYYAHNYLSVRDDDRQIIRSVRDHFACEYDEGRLRHGALGIDVGTGPNLYPALTMLPFCANVTLFERAQPNIDW